MSRSARRRALEKTGGLGPFVLRREYVEIPPPAPVRPEDPRSPVARPDPAGIERLSGVRFEPGETATMRDLTEAARAWALRVAPSWSGRCRERLARDAAVLHLRRADTAA